MKLIVTILLVLVSAALLFSQPIGFSEFQKDLSIQAARYQNSTQHQALRQRPARSYVVGDTETFWKWNLAVMPPAWVQTPSTCRAVGEHCYVFVANSDWGTHMTQANVDSVLVRLEDNTPNNAGQGAIEMDISLFGPIPNELDNDDKLIVFYSALGSFQGSQFDGYFSPYNQVTEAEAQQMNPSGHSNECEMIYMTCYPLSPVAPIRLSVLAHELEHLIHWGQDANEESWLDEGCAELAMVAYGVPDPISSFPANPDNDLTAWNQTTADYVKVMLFFTYLSEHYDDTGMISALIADPANGINSLSNQITAFYPGLDLGMVLRNWTVANALDSHQPDAGLYNYLSLDLPNFTMTSINQHPTMGGLSIQPHAADYLRYNAGEDPYLVAFTLGDPIYVSMLVFDNSGECLYVSSALQAGDVNYSPLPEEAAYVIFVLTNVGNSTIQYVYDSGYMASEDAVVSESPAMSLTCYPNPFTAAGSSLQIRANNLKSSATSNAIQIYNLKGQLVRTLTLSKTAGQDTWQTTWDGLDARQAAVSSGVYMIRYSKGNSLLNKSILYLK